MLVFRVYSLNDTDKQHSLLDTTFTMSFILDLQENIYAQVPQTHYMSAGEASRHIEGFLDLFIDVFLEVQDNKI